MNSAPSLPKVWTSPSIRRSWGPQGATGEVMLIYSRAFSRERWEELFESVAEVGHVQHPFVMPGENNRTLLLCRGLKIPMKEFWRLIKIFI